MNLPAPQPPTHDAMPRPIVLGALLLLASAPACDKECGAGWAPSGGDCVYVGGEDSGGDTATGSDETVLFEEHFDGSMGEWQLSDAIEGGAECGVEDDAYRTAIWLPEAGEAEGCALLLERGFDLSGATEAWIELGYDVSHYDEQGGANDGALIGFALSDGDVEDWKTIAWTRSGGEDPERIGTVRTDLEDFAGWSEDFHVSVGLSLYSCENEDRPDCGYRNLNDDAAWITVDDFVIVTR